jgi:hypothetical protein
VQITKSCGIGGEAVADFSGLLGAADLVVLVAGIVAAVSVAGGVVVRVASASVVIAAIGSSATTVGGTAITATPAAAATAPTVVDTMRGSSRISSRAVGCWLVFSTDMVAFAICWGAAATSGFVVSNGSDSVVDPREVGILSKLGDDFTCTVPLGLPCYHSDRHEALLRGGVHPVGNLSRASLRFRIGRASRRCRYRSFHFMLRSRQVFLSSVVSFGGALTVNSSSEMSSRYRSGCSSEVLASPAAMKTSRSGVQRMESVIAISVGVCSSSFVVNGVPS